MSFNFGAAPKNTRESAPRSVRFCPGCQRDKATRWFCRSSPNCYDCRKRKAPRRVLVDGRPTPTQLERLRVQAALERARAVANEARAAQGLPVLHGCTPIERDVPMSERGMHRQLVTV